MTLTKTQGGAGTWGCSKKVPVQSIKGIHVLIFVIVNEARYYNEFIGLSADPPMAVEATTVSPLG